jgi:hypothetical protein
MITSSQKEAQYHQWGHRLFVVTIESPPKEMRDKYSSQDWGIT